MMCHLNSICVILLSFKAQKSVNYSIFFSSTEIGKSIIFGGMSVSCSIRAFLRNKSLLTRNTIYSSHSIWPISIPYLLKMELRSLVSDVSDTAFIISSDSYFFSMRM